MELDRASRKSRGTCHSRSSSGVVCYDHGALYGTDYHGGHVNVFDRVNGDSVRLLDPHVKHAKWAVFGMDQLYQAMKANGPNKSGGLWRLVPARD